MEISTRALNQAKDQALRQVARAKIYWQTHVGCTWAEIEKYLGIAIPDQFKSAPRITTFSELSAWGDWYKLSVESRLKATLGSDANTFKAKTAVVAAAKDIKVFTTIGEFTLLPEQQAAYDAIIRDFFVEKKHRAGLQDGRTGAGKTPLALAYIKHCLDMSEVKNGLWIQPIQIFCPPGLMEHWYRHLERAGMGNLIGNAITCIPYSGLSSSVGSVYVKEEVDPISDRTKLTWNPALAPFAAVFDECHRLKNDSFQTRAILALLRSKTAPYTLWLSATPFVTTNDTRAFCIATKAKILDMQITEETFPVFAGLVCREPHKPNLAAAKRLRELLSPYIYSMPKVKWEHKAINDAILVDFASDQDRLTYHSAYEKYLEKCQTLGKNTDFGRFEQFVALGQFRCTVEPLRMDAIVNRCHQHILKGDKAPVIGVVFRNSVIRAAFGLKKLGYRREDISIIWGGKEELKTNLILSESEFAELFAKTLRGEELSKSDVKKIEVTLRFKEEKLSYGEMRDEESLARLSALADFGLQGNQTPTKRQVEIDRFQNGDSKICILTAAAGGVGLSLDQWHERLLPREGYFSPTYSGPEFQQLLGRLPRRLTKSDTRQHIVGMRGTIEESHVIPLIDAKLRCIAEITNNDYSIIDFHKAKVVDLGRIRTEEEVLRDAEDEKSQLNYDGDSSTSDDDETY